MAFLDSLFASSQPSLFSPAWVGRRKFFFIATCMSFLLFQLLFLANESYIFGILFRANTRIKAFNVLFVDYDQGAIGDSVRSAYSQISGDGFVTLQEHSPSSYASASAIEDAVCRGDFWGAVLVSSGASEQLATTLAGDATEPWDVTTAATAMHVGIRYPIIQQSYISPDIQTLFAAARANYIVGLAGSNISSDLSTITPYLAQPFSFTSHDVAATPPSTNPFYNTATVVFVILMQFFCILAFNGICQGFGIFSGASIRSHLAVRFSYSIIFTLVGSLLTTGYLFAFQDTWGLIAAQFGQTWMLLWLSMHVNWLVLDTAAGFFPIAAVPFFTFTWIIVNMASTVMPFEISPGFYRIGYMWPAHNMLEVLIQIWSGGCYNRLYRTLPVLFSWELVAAVVDLFAQVRRCKTMAQVPADEALTSSSREFDGTPEEKPAA
ncbi:uncharacterized protein BCR38DRAFT_415666 [Pseudomassariella vexata]|uniref:DUF3533 domain-containing protein n=1 Tax=Pseudomassariella vexata TaxID=1141098 RepID=A0A1Y2EHF2_9PEZI|nr:uncharacterized protein BCR38DRAFT_415666 [Pseudomassariella vexata]ORY70993.1 hypothetical protein BCR38DRAFT_415666 [Pseudomassariella vexata]